MSYASRREPTKVGFWKGLDPRDDDEPYPDVRGFIDPSWNAVERAVVIHYVSDPRFRGDTCRGWSDCRLCGKRNGSADFNDEIYVWPEGFGHYLSDHHVRPPADFVAHVLRKPFRPRPHRPIGTSQRRRSYEETGEAIERLLARDAELLRRLARR